MKNVVLVLFIAIKYIIAIAINFASNRFQKFKY